MLKRIRMFVLYIYFILCTCYPSNGFRKMKKKPEREREKKKCSNIKFSYSRLFRLCGYLYHYSLFFLLRIYILFFVSFSFFLYYHHHQQRKKKHTHIKKQKSIV